MSAQTVEYEAPPLRLSRPRGRLRSADPVVPPRLSTRRIDFDPASLSGTVKSLALGIAEALQGLRNAQTLRRWFDIDLYEKFVKHVEVRKALGHGPASGGVGIGEPRLCSVNPSVVEAVVVVRTSTRHCALALRLEKKLDHWILTQLLTL